MDALQEIRDRIRGCDLPLMEQTVFTRTDLRPVLAAVEEKTLVDKGLFLDVPIKTIIGLSHDIRNFDPFGNPSHERLSWRIIVNEILHGDEGTWDERIFDYFESEINDRVFPARKAQGPLTVSSIGGAVICSNGNHRLPAGIAWLAATQGEQAEFRKVETSVSVVNKDIIRHLDRWRKSGMRVSAAFGALGTCYFRTERRQKVKTFRFIDGGMKRVYDPQVRVIPHWRPFGNDLAWVAVPDALLDAWMAPDWTFQQPWPAGIGMVA